MIEVLVIIVAVLSYFLVGALLVRGARYLLPDVDILDEEFLGLLAIIYWPAAIVIGVVGFFFWGLMKLAGVKGD